MKSEHKAKDKISTMMADMEKHGKGASADMPRGVTMTKKKGKKKGHKH